LVFVARCPLFLFFLKIRVFLSHFAPLVSWINDKPFFPLSSVPYDLDLTPRGCRHFEAWTPPPPPSVSGKFFIPCRLTLAPFLFCSHNPVFLLEHGVLVLYWLVALLCGPGTGNQFKIALRLQFSEDAIVGGGLVLFVPRREGISCNFPVSQLETPPVGGTISLWFPAGPRLLCFILFLFFW